MDRCDTKLSLEERNWYGNEYLVVDLFFVLKPHNVTPTIFGNVQQQTSTFCDTMKSLFVGGDYTVL